MDREEALQELQNFKNRTGLSRDKMIDLLKKFGFETKVSKDKTTYFVK